MISKRYSYIYRERNILCKVTVFSFFQLGGLWLYIWESSRHTNLELSSSSKWFRRVRDQCYTSQRSQYGCFYMSPHTMQMCMRVISALAGEHTNSWKADVFTTLSYERQSTRGSCMCAVYTALTASMHVSFLNKCVCACLRAYAGVGGSLCGWSPGVLWGMMFWSEMRQNKQERSGEEEKKPSDKVQTSQRTLCLLWLGPSSDLHIKTPWPPNCNSHTHTHVRPRTHTYLD